MNDADADADARAAEHVPSADPARAGEPAIARETALALALAEAERERDERERQIEHLRRALSDAAHRIGETDRERAVQAHRARRAEWQAEKMRRRRWWRLGGVVTAVRRRPLSPASYRGLRTALRARPVPAEPPAEPRLPRHPEIRAADTELLGDVPALDFPDGPVNRPGITAAVVASPVVAAALRYEWRQLDAAGPGWRELFEAERPDLLFAESGGDRDRLEEMVAWCREHGVPTAYWDTGGGTPGDARLFDHVFAAGECSYGPTLDRVHELPFAAQPRLHNPMRGPDHGRYPLLYEGDYDSGAEVLLGPAPKLGAHFYGEGFPDLYRQRVVPELPYEQALTARKRYQVLIAPHPRLEYEAAAAGIPVVRPDAVDGAEDATREATRLLRALLAAPEMRDRRAHLALRDVHARHTYRHRVGTVLETVLGTRNDIPAPSVSLVLPTCRAEQIGPAIERAARQEWRPLQLVLVLHGLDLDPALVEKRARGAGLDDVVVVEADAELPLGACLNLGVEAAGGAYIGKIDDDELYGPHYVSDLVPAFGYTDASVVGKLAHYTHLASIDAMVLRHPGLEHRYVHVLRGGALLADGDLLREYRFAEVGRGEDTDLFRRLREDGVLVYAADRYSFVTIRHADPERHTWRPSDLELLADGRVVHYGPGDRHVLF